MNDCKQMTCLDCVNDCFAEIVQKHTVYQVVICAVSDVLKKSLRRESHCESFVALYHFQNLLCPMTCF